MSTIIIESDAPSNVESEPNLIFRAEQTILAQLSPGDIFVQTPVLGHPMSTWQDSDFSRRVYIRLRGPVPEGQETVHCYRLSTGMTQQELDALLASNKALAAEVEELHAAHKNLAESIRAVLEIAGVDFSSEGAK